MSVDYELSTEVRHWRGDEEWRNLALTQIVTLIE